MKWSKRCLPRPRWVRCGWAALIFWLSGWVTPVLAQEGLFESIAVSPAPPASSQPPAPPPPPAPTPTAPTEGVVQASCSTCGGGGGVLGMPPPADGGCATCGSGLLGAVSGDGIPCATGCTCAPCYPGQVPCDCCCTPHTGLGRFLDGLYHCICCPDPCYQPRWVALANSAFFVDQVKPVTQMILRGDFAGEVQFPDRAEYFWARENAKGPHFPGRVPPGAHAPGEPNVDFSRGVLYTEGAVNRFSAFVALSYLNVEPTLYPGASGFGDMFIGTKSLLLDCDLIQFTFQFETFLPTGNFTKGLGTGHVALDPSLITAIKLTPITYLQAQTSYWFPLGGTPTYQGPVFNYQFSINQLLYRCGCARDVQIIGTAELGGYEFAGGAYTSPVTGLPMSAKDVTNIVNVGPGLRLVICNKIDIGAGSQFAISKDRFAAAMARIEFRWRF
jgi:hypothetical protein